MLEFSGYGGALMRVVKVSVIALLVAGLATAMMAMPASARSGKTHSWDSWSTYHQGVKARDDMYTFNYWVPWQFKRSRNHKHVKREVRVVGHYEWNFTGKLGHYRRTKWHHIRAGQKLTFHGPIKLKCNSNIQAMLIESAQVRSKRNGHWTKPISFQEIEGGASVYGDC